jgi:Mg-chelatase subunit ChlD
MFAKGPMPGGTPKEDALKLLPEGTTCQRMTGMGITGYVVLLPDGRDIASAGNAGKAWRQAADWASRHLPPAARD